MPPSTASLRCTTVLLTLLLATGWGCIQNPDTIEASADAGDDSDVGADADAGTDTSDTTPPEDTGPVCDGDLTLCTDPADGAEQCVDTDVDPRPCGGCGISCRSGDCVDGKCQPFPCEFNDNADPGQFGQYFGGGSGTAHDPFTICSAEQFHHLATHNRYWSYHFALSDDIDLAELELDSFPMIHNFYGSFDGFGFTVDNLTINVDQRDVAPFVSVHSSGRITSVNFDNLYVHNHSHADHNRAGGIVATNLGEITDVTVQGTIVGHQRVGAVAGINHGRIDDADVTVDVRGASSWVGGIAGWSNNHINDVRVDGAVAGRHDVGGVVGHNAYRITDSNVEAVVEAPPEGQDHSDGHVGGIAGSNGVAARIADCSFDGRVHNTADHTGGIVGYSNDAGVIANCQADVELRGHEYIGGIIGEGVGTDVIDSSATADIDGGNRSIGGIAGRMINHSTIAGCDADVTIDVNPQRLVGGLVGQFINNSTITDSTAAGQIHLDSANNSGGLAGRIGQHSSATDCEADVAVVVTNQHGGNNNIGGLVGRFDNDSTIQRCRADGDVSVDDGERIGGLIGRAESNSQVVESFAAGDVTGADAVGGLIGDIQHDTAGATDVYATGDTSATDGDAAALVGRTDGSLQYCYAVGVADGQPGWLVPAGDTDTTGCVALAENGDNQLPTDTLTTGEFGDADNFPDWDFDNIWLIPDADDVDDGDFARPRLQWEFQ